MSKVKKDRFYIVEGNDSVSAITIIIKLDKKYEYYYNKLLQAGKQNNFKDVIEYNAKSEFYRGELEFVLTYLKSANE